MSVLGGLGGVLGALCPTLKYSKPPTATITQMIREKTVSFSLANNPAMALDYSYRMRTARETLMEYALARGQRTSMRWTRIRIRPEIDIAWVRSDSPQIGLNGATTAGHSGIDQCDLHRERQAHPVGTR